MYSDLYQSLYLSLFVSPVVSNGSSANSYVRHNTLITCDIYWFDYHCIPTPMTFSNMSLCKMRTQLSWERALTVRFSGKKAWMYSLHILKMPWMAFCKTGTALIQQSTLLTCSHVSSCCPRNWFSWCTMLCWCSLFLSNLGGCCDDELYRLAMHELGEEAKTVATIVLTDNGLGPGIEWCIAEVTSSPAFSFLLHVVQRWYINIHSVLIVTSTIWSVLSLSSSPLLFPLVSLSSAHRFHSLDTSFELS